MLRSTKYHIQKMTEMNSHGLGMYPIVLIQFFSTLP